MGVSVHSPQVTNPPRRTKVPSPFKTRLNMTQSPMNSTPVRLHKTTRVRAVHTTPVTVLDTAVVAVPHTTRVGFHNTNGPVHHHNALCNGAGGKTRQRHNHQHKALHSVRP